MKQNIESSLSTKQEIESKKDAEIKFYKNETDSVKQQVEKLSKKVESLSTENK